ncbi:protein of unknown function [Streptomyces murinus]
MSLTDRTSHVYVEDFPDAAPALADGGEMLA